jgi:hypothetical protein
VFDVVLGGGPAYVPGLFANITVPTSSVVVFTSQGGIENMGAPGDFVRVAIRLMVDDVVKEFGEYDLEHGNFSCFGRWSLSIALPLSAGSHSVGVQAQMTRNEKAGTSAAWPRAIVGGTEIETSHGTLTAIVMKQ